MKNDFKEQILRQNVQMDGAVNFNVNGDITVIPCPWESDKEVTEGKRIRYRAGIEVDIDGRTHVKRYNDGKRGAWRETIFETAHGAVKVSRPRFVRGRRQLARESVFVTLRFPKSYGLALIKTLFLQESDEMMAYLKTRKEETIWNQ